MIGGGIGVTPYASILTDLVMEKTSGRYTNIKCEKACFSFKFHLRTLQNLCVKSQEVGINARIYVFYPTVIHDDGSSLLNYKVKCLFSNQQNLLFLNVALIAED